jgi:glycosyltransferase involved in cell wall biosynthesis
MRILICALEAPLPPANGLRLQVSSLARELRRDHQVRVVAFSAPDQVEEEAPGWVRVVPRPSVAGPVAILRAAIRRRPTGLIELGDALAPPVSEEIATFLPDVVHVTPGRLATLGRHLSGVPTVLAALDAWHLNVAAQAVRAGGLRGLFLRDEVARAKRFEAEEHRRFARVTVVSSADAEALLALHPGQHVTVIPNGVDADDFAPDAGAARVSRLVLFTGVMGYAPNVDAAVFLARRVLPFVRAELPDARLALVGRDPSRDVRALAAVDGVEVVGEVPEMRPWLSKARVYACPMVSGTGIKNKLLEAMANGLPCVATPLAVRGLDVGSGRELLIATDEKALAANLLSVLTDERLAERIGAAAREYVLRHHGWNAVGRAYENLYLEVLSGPQP